MRKRKKYLPLLLLGLLSCVGVFFYIFFIDPATSFDVGKFSISPISLFFILLLISLSSFASFMFLNLRRGILFSIFICSILVVRFFGYANLFSIGIIFVVVVLLELGFKNTKKSETSKH